MILASLAILLIALCISFKKRFEEMLPPFVCALMLLCWLLAMFSALSSLQWIGAGCALLAAAWTLVQAVRLKRRGFLHSVIRYVCTPSLVGFLALAAGYSIAAQGHFIQVPDDIICWAVQVRSLVANGGLVDAVHHLSPLYMDYPAGVQALQWIGVTVCGEWNEHVLFLVLWLLFVSFLLPFGRKITWKKAYWLPVLVLCIWCAPTIMNIDTYNSLRVDTLLGICFGYSLMAAWRVRSDGKNAVFHLLCFSLSLCALVLIKQIGVAWALLSICFLLLVRRPWKANTINGWRIAAAIALPALVLFGWQVFCWAKGLSGKHLANAADAWQSMASGTWSATQTHWETVRTTLQVLLYTHRDLGFPDGRWLELSKIGWVVLLALLPVLMGLRSPARGRPLFGISVFVLASFVLFLAGFLLLWNTAFGSEFSNFSQGANPWCYYLLERYFCPFTIGFLMLLMVVWQEEYLVDFAPGSRRVGLFPQWKNVLSCLALAALLMLSDWSQLKKDFWPDVPQEGNGMESLMAENFWVEDLEAPHRAVVLYGVEAYPPSIYKLQYVIAPAKLVLVPSLDMTEADFLAFLKENHITHMVCMDEFNTVYENAEPYVDGGWLDVVMPYAIHWEEDGPLFVY